MATKTTKFFIPRTKPSHYETAYGAMKTAVKYQMGWTAGERRIASLRYASGKRELTAKVGEFGQVEHQYQVVAILEAALYIIVTVNKTGDPGPSILVDTKDVLAVVEFGQPVTTEALAATA